VEFDAETICCVNVTDEDGRLVGVLSMRDLIVARPVASIGDVMIREPVAYGRVSTEPGESRTALAAPPAREPVNPLVLALIGPGAAVGEVAIPIPVTMMGSKLRVSEPPTLTVRMLPWTVADALSDPGDFAVDGVPTNQTVEPAPAASSSVTWNDPMSGAIPATPASLNDRPSVFPEECPRWMAPTPLTVTLPNAGGAAVAR
jgi:hypothetical protein